jgi:HK97 gp10 family phage protein
LVQGIEQLKARLAKSGVTLESAAGAAMLQAGEVVASSAKFLVPKDTGHLAASIKVSGLLRTPRDNLKVEISAGDESTIVQGRVSFQLAKIVELGTVKRRAEPFLRPAMRMNSRKIRTMIRKAMREAIKVANGSNTTAGT